MQGMANHRIVPLAPGPRPPSVLAGQQCRPRAALHASRRCTAANATQATGAPADVGSSGGARKLVEWMQANGLPEGQKVRVATTTKDHDYTVASEDIAAGDVVLRVPENLVVTLASVFEDGAVAELLTTNKLSELACLTLYLSYEKKRGEESFWHPFIRELDHQRGRGPQGARSPLLWQAGQAEELLAGSPVLAQIKERLKGIEREYKELDTVWFMAGSLFREYPYDVPTEAFSLETFKQAFAAVQSCVVHLQGVGLCRRFALVPLGPPLLAYSSTAKAMLKWDPEAGEVQLVADRPYAAGDPVTAWCGPQPNSRLLINYGIVDEDNPYDKLPLSVRIPSSDPLYRSKRDRLAEQGLSTQQTFQLTRAADPLPAELLPHMRLVQAETAEEAAAVRFGDGAGPASAANEARVLGQLAGHLRSRLARYRTSVEQDEATIADASAGSRHRVAAKLLKIEKGILQAGLAQLMRMPGAAEAAAAPQPLSAVILE